MKRLWHIWREGVIVTGLFSLASIVMTYPLLFQLNSGLASQSLDVWILAWDNWWVQQALSTGQNIFYTHLLFFPQGVSLAAHSFSFTHSIISLLFQPFVGSTAAYNLGILLIFPVSGLGMYLLARHITGSKMAAWLAGLVYAFAPYHMTQALGHPHLAYVQWIPFAILFLLKAIRSQRARNVIFAIIFFTLTAYSGQHLLVLAFTWVVIFIPLYWLFDRPRWNRAAWLRLGLIITGTIVLSLPLVWPAASDVLHGQAVQELQTGDQDNAQTDALAYLIPSRYHPVFGPALADTYGRLSKNNNWMPYLGYTALILSVIGSIALRRRSLPWVISGAACIVLALGTQLRFNGIVYANVPLPFTLLQNVFPFSFLRSPDRFNVVVSLPLAILAAYGFAALTTKRFLTRRSALPISVAVLSALILFEYLNVPYPIMPLPETSPFVTQLAQDPASDAVLDLPMGRNPSKLYLYWQTLHHQPIVEGHVSRTPAIAYQFIEANALLSALRDPGSIELSAPQRSAALHQLAANHIRYILVHIAMSNPDQIKKYHTLIGFDPIYTDDFVQVYAVAP